MSASGTHFKFKNTRFMKHVLIPVLLAIVVKGNAQYMLVPAKGSFDTKWLRNQTVKMDFYTIRDTTKALIGEITTTTKLVDTRIFIITVVRFNGVENSFV